jgi:hypothetical protein
MMPHITQHELFIRAAMEGRRDHVYQAAMFDPLTAATMPTDKIVEMCDELIAAHGDLLPKLDAPTLVPTSGKVFAPVNPEDLRASWEERKQKRVDEAVHDWQVIGPFSTGTELVSTASPTPLEASMGADGRIDLAAAYGDLKWQPVKAKDLGYVSLDTLYGKEVNGIAYAYAEVTSVHAREALLRSGSDDGIKVWLNGEVVFEKNVRRSYREDQDCFDVYLQEGINRILVKITNADGTWGFGMAVPLADF